jgi:hypothetical protein
LGVVHHHDGTSETIPTRRSYGAGASSPANPATAVRAIGPASQNDDEPVVASLGELVHARSGDKGGDAHLRVWVRDREAWDWLRSTLTVDELRRPPSRNK